MKPCRKCEITKPVSEFYADQRTPDGLRHWCKDCWNAYCRQRWADGRTDRAKKAETDRAWRKANPDRAALIHRRSRLRKRFGISLEDYERMLADQGGRCAGCGSTDNGDPRFDTFAVDHDHRTGAVRGLLCSPCNRACGQAGDDPDRLMALAAYLLQHADVLSDVTGKA